MHKDKSFISHTSSVQISNYQKNSDRPLNADGDEGEGAGVDRGWLHQGYHIAEHRAERKVSQTEDDDLKLILTCERDRGCFWGIPLIN